MRVIRIGSVEIVTLTMHSQGIGNMSVNPMSEIS